MTALKIPPGPRGHWLLGSLRERRADALGFYRKTHREYGDIVGFRLGQVPVVMLCHPNYAKHVLIDNAAKYSKGGMVDRLRPTLGNGLLTSEGDFWLKQRRLMAPAFHRERLASLVTMTTESAEREMDKWRSSVQRGESIDIAKELLKLTLDTAGKALFGVSIVGEADEVGRALNVALEESNQRLLGMINIPINIPTPSNLRLRGAIRALDKVVYGIIDKRRRGESSGEDLLALLMEARDEDTGEGMNDLQLRDEVMTLFLAGHETSASALAWLCYLLAKHPDIQEQLRAELQTALGARAIAGSDFPNLPLCNQALQEAMRLYPPAWGIPRVAKVDDEVDGHLIARRSLVFISTYLIHRHEQLWPSPDEFDPGRFHKSKSEGRHRHAFMPFGAGQRTCIGGPFATTESIVTLASLLRRYRMHLVADHPVEPLPLVVLRSKHGIRVKLEPLN